MLERIARHPLPWLLLVCGVDFMFMLGGHTLWDVDEPNNAVCAREMLAAGNWWVPVFNGGLRFDKPILLYWLMMPLFHWFGVHEWTARLPSALAITALTWVVFHFTRRLADGRTGLVAALLFATALHVVVIARAATPDPLLMLCVGFALLAFIVFWLEGAADAKLIMAAWAALGVGMLAKGPVALLLPGLIVLLFLLLRGELRKLGRMRPVAGLLLALAIALPWYVAVGVLTDGEWLKGFILHHNIDRFTGALQGHRGFPGFYVISFLAGWFPWTGLLLAALLFAPWRLRALREDPLRLFLLCWIGVFLVFFTIARTRLPNYMLPTFPAAAVLMAVWASANDEKAGAWLARGAVGFSALLMVAAAVALQWQWPGEWVYALCFLPVLAAAVFSLGRGPEHGVPALAAGMMACVMLLAGWALPAFDRHKVTRDLAMAATKAGFGPDALATYRYFQPSLLYYHGGRLPMLKNMREVAGWLMRGKAVVMPEQSLAEFPPAVLPHLVVHRRRHGLVARKWLLLVSLQPVEGASWPMNP